MKFSIIINVDDELQEEIDAVAYDEATKRFGDEDSLSEEQLELFDEHIEKIQEELWEFCKKTFLSKRCMSIEFDTETNSAKVVVKTGDGK